jgi:sarcosine oxidase subunit gamma
MRNGEAFQISEIHARAVVCLKPWSLNQLSPSLVPPGLGGEVRVLSFGPQESFMVSERIAGPKLREQLERHVEGIAAVDLSCAIKVLRVEGLAVSEVLAKGCGLDLDPRRFPAGRCTRTRLAQLAVVIDCIEPSSCFDLYVGRSHMTYLHTWLVDAATGLPMPADTRS